jgi:hypothetical protein
VTKLRPAYAMRGIAPQGPGISRTMRVGEVANRSGGKSGIIGRERVIEILCNQLRIVAVFSSIECGRSRHSSFHFPFAFSSNRAHDHLHW